MEHLCTLFLPPHTVNVPLALSPLLQFPCPYCKKTFLSMAGLRYHTTSRVCIGAAAPNKMKVIKKLSKDQQEIKPHTSSGSESEPDAGAAASAVSEEGSSPNIETHEPSSRTGRKPRRAAIKAQQKVKRSSLIEASYSDSDQSTAASQGGPPEKSNHHGSDDSESGDMSSGDEFRLSSSVTDEDEDDEIETNDDDFKDEDDSEDADRSEDDGSGLNTDDGIDLSDDEKPRIGPTMAMTTARYKFSIADRILAHKERQGSNRDSSSAGPQLETEIATVSTETQSSANAALHMWCLPENDRITPLSSDVITTLLPDSNAAVPFTFGQLDSDVQCPDRWAASPGPVGSSTIALNVGGPVQELEWCPSEYLNSEGETPIYLAVTSGQTINATRHLRLSSESAAKSLSAVPSQSLIQIWSWDKGGDESDVQLPKMTIGLAVPCAEILRMVWCPSGVRQRPDSIMPAGKLSRLGVLAVAGGAVVQLHPVAHPPTLADALSEAHGRALDDAPLIVASSPAAELVLGVAIVTDVAWSSDSSRAWLAAGYADGNVALFCLDDLNTMDVRVECAAVSANADSGRPCPELLPRFVLKALDGVVRSLSYCPDDCLLAVTGHCETVRVWDLSSRKVVEDIYTMPAPKDKWKHAVVWPDYFPGVFYAGDEARLRFIFFGESKPDNAIIHSLAGNVHGIDFSPWLCAAACGSDDGAAFVVMCPLQDCERGIPAQSSAPEISFRLAQCNTVNFGIDHSAEPAVAEERTKDAAHQPRVEGDRTPGRFGLEVKVRIPGQSDIMTYGRYKPCLSVKAEQLAQANRGHAEAGDSTRTEEFYPAAQAIRKVKWCLTEYRCSWLASGTGTGLVLLQDAMPQADAVLSALSC